LQEVTGFLRGEPAPPEITIQEDSARFLVDVQHGHKTGFYLDQRPNRRLLGEMDSGDVLNLFSYTGGFGVHALRAGASRVVNVDASREALELAERNVGINGIAADRAEFIQADVFEYLRDAAAAGEQFDTVICDPPKFAQNAQQVERAARGYKDLNLNAFRLIKPGGHLMTFSCSGSVSPDLFQKIVFGALADSGRQAQIIRHLGAGEDHPVALTFPEGEYLKGLLLRVY
jgi:23S rRNA (cytosine1962-C5)-methyltransferase